MLFALLSTSATHRIMYMILPLFNYSHKINFQDTKHLNIFISLAKFCHDAFILDTSSKLNLFSWSSARFFCPLSFAKLSALPQPQSLIPLFFSLASSSALLCFSASTFPDFTLLAFPFLFFTFPLLQSHPRFGCELGEIFLRKRI